jgi:chemotaxis protein CheX
MTEYLEGLLQSAITGIFSTMLNLDVQLEAPGTALADGELHVAGAVGLTGNLNGIIYFYSSATFAHQLTNFLLRAPAEQGQTDEMVNDTVGELTNMVAGHVRSCLSDRGFACAITIPTVVRGRDFSIESVSGAERRTLCMRCNGNLVRVVLLIKPTTSRIM